MENYEKYVGMIFDGRYRIQRIIGLGGMAVVFEAEDLLMHRTVAVKMLKEGVGDDATSVKRRFPCCRIRISSAFMMFRCAKI